MHPLHMFVNWTFTKHHSQKTKAIVIPSWLRDSVQSGVPLPCGNYTAVHGMEDETSRNCPDTTSSPENEISWRTEPDDPVDATETESLSHKAKYSCLRSSPLVCPNQSLVEEIDVIQRSRNVEGEERSALSYSRAISVSSNYFLCNIF